MNPFPYILDFLNAKLVTIFGMASGILIFLLLPNVLLEQLKAKDLEDIWRTSALLIDTILWSFLFSKLAVFLFNSLQGHISERRKRRIALNYFDADQTITIAEIITLVRLKLKDETHFFSAQETDDALLKLCAKGLLQKTKWCRGVGQEYMVPKYIWTSRRLKDLTKKYGKDLSN